MENQHNQPIMEAQATASQGQLHRDAVNQNSAVVAQTDASVQKMAHGAADLVEGATVGVVGLAQGAAIGAANLAEGAAGAVKNSFESNKQKS